MHSYILLDRSGSMVPMWREALSSIDAYVEELARPEPGFETRADTKVTLAAFDSHAGEMAYDILRDAVSIETWVGAQPDEVSPRGMTPLFDAVARTIQTALDSGGEKVVVVIMTDGCENASREHSSRTLKALLKQARDRGWEIIFLGADFSDFTDAEALGIRESKRMAMARGSMREAKMALAQRSRRYAMGLESGIDFDEADRKKASEDRVRRRR